MPSTSSVSTPRGMIRSDNSRAYFCSVSMLPVSRASM